jgi:aryl-alcohol dehydrogenase-like predicted oxidoreductase
MSLKLRPLGRTGLTVSRIGLGLAALGRPAYINVGHGSDLGADRSVETMRRRAHQVLDEAFGAGIRYFDAARSYGLAEEFLSSWVHERDADLGPVVVGSKWGYEYVAGWEVDAEVHEVKDHSVGMLRRQFAESRALLGDRLNLYQVHSATLETGVLTDQAVLEELVRVRNQGIVVGLTTSGPGQGDAVRAALESTVDGVNPFMCVQATWNLLEWSAGDALAAAHDGGWGVIIKEAVANGRLTPRDTVASERVSRVAERHGVSVDAVAIAAVLRQPWADVVLSGAATAGQLRSNVTALDVSLSDADVAELMEMSGPPAEYWSTRAAMQWQ